MIKINIDNKEFLFIESPENSYDFWIHLNTISCRIIGGNLLYKEIYKKESIYTKKQFHECLELNYKILSTTKEISQELYDTFLQCEKLDSNKNYLILEQKM